MNESRRTSISKFLSLVLRHSPETVGISLDAQGWVGVDELLAACGQHGRSISRAELDEVVAISPKRRFAFSEDGRRIRASQGHSVSVDLGYEPSDPPAVLYHGTVARALEAIREDGLRPMQRHHVHLSADIATALSVGGRRGAPVVLVIDAAAMSAAGIAFFVSANGVWLTEHVPSRFISSWGE
ncbi:MAG: RNA 2'-phosphotransferase [Actinobacteria bacterium HGW-Actinobacteria-2]|nr:MAG: RNA 2'-phosphotransferase [Actinobacteria bacterium HGW-Actinobacteria-2]